MIRDAKVLEAYVRDLLDSMPDACFLVDAAGNLVLANPRLETMFGYTSEELRGRPIDCLVPERFRVAHAGHCLHYFARPRARPMGIGLDLRGVQKDGREFPVEISLGPIETNEGTFVLGTVRDISQSEERYRAVFEQVAAGAVHSDTDGRLLNVNPKFCEISGYTREEALRLGIRDLVHATDIGRVLEMRTRVLAGRGSNYEYEARLTRNDGREIWAHITTAIVRGRDGRPLHFISLVHDVSEQKRAEDALRESELRFKQLAENIHEVFWLVDISNSQILYVSPAYEAIWGRHPGALYSSRGDWLRAIHPEDRERVRKAAQAQAGGSYDEEYRIVRPDGQVRWIRDRAFPVRDEAGRIIRVAGVAEDVTHRREAAAKIRRLNRVYAVLSGINALIVRASNREDLLREACRIAVDAGEFSIAWSGILDPETKALKPIAWHGVDERFVEAICAAMRAADTGLGGVVGKTLQDKKPVVASDVEGDPNVLERAWTIALGSRAIVGLPLIVADQVRGVLMLHAREPGRIDNEEKALLVELAGDLSFAFDHLEKAERLNYLAFYDSLTGLPNRALFIERLGQILQTSARGSLKTAVLVIDIDRFRTVNETYGRQVGDELLRQLADRATRIMTHASGLARIGLDQFAAIVPEAPTLDAIIRRTGQRVQQILGNPFVLNKREIRLSAKIGIALCPDDGAEPDELLHRAEVALKNAKSSGESFLFYAPEMTARAAENLALENRLRVALERQQFVLHYQPKVDLRVRRIVGAEALIRWQDPELGLVPPAKFISLMEETGLILEVGAWALSQAIAAHRRWVEQGLAGFRIAVNVSALQLRQPDFVTTVRREVGLGASPPGIDLEITESLVMGDMESNIGKLRQIRDLGINIVIDDFGTGYSSLGYLARLPVTSLKIDRSFIVDMLDKPSSATLVQTIISLAHSLDLRVIAEGVETEEQAKVLRLLRCDEMQGYLFSPAIPFGEITAMLGGSARS